MHDLLNPRDIALILGACSALWFIKLYLGYRQLAQSVDNVPGMTTIFGEVLLSRVLPPIPGIIRGDDWSWRFKYSEYKANGLDILAIKSFLPRIFVTLQVADADAWKDITANRAAFPKPTEEYKAVNLFGPNIIGSEGDEWKRHRKVVAKAFSEPNNRLVWQETVKVIFELFNMWEMEGRSDEVVIENVAALTKDLALMVISAAAFGMSLSWKEDGTLPPGHSLTFKKTLHSASTGVKHRVVFPDWFLGLYSYGRETILAFKELRAYMTDMIQERTTAPESRQDLFSNLLRAREEEKDGSTVFSDSDLIGNIFILLFAGHDTTSHTLAFAFGLLALYPEVQNRFLAQIDEVVAPGQLPTYADIPKLTYALAIMQETLRLFSIVTDVLKYSAHGTSFTTERNDGTKRVVPVPAGTFVRLDMTGLHYNPKYWEDPEEFRPERFLGEYNKNAWGPFSMGARACIGRRFAEIEAIAVLTLFVKHYRVEVTHDPKFATETFEMRKKRILNAKYNSVLLHAVKVPLTFKRRH